jgi:ABC-2 type transport system ATP-binding protein
MSNRQPENAVEFRDLTKYYGDSLGVANLSFSVEPGEVFGFLGPNGAGKTTAIRILMGLITPTSGEAFVHGENVVAADPSYRQDIGYLPGAFSPYRNMTGGEFLKFLSQMRSLDCSEYFNELAERFDLDLSRPISALSKGNRQKLGVVQAFMHKPSVLILDEPTGGLDPLVQHEFEKLLSEAKAWGAAIVLSSHVLSEVEHLADRVAILHLGRMLVVEHISILKQQAVRTISVSLNQPATSADFANVTGIDSMRIHGNRVTCNVTGEVTQFLEVIVKFGVESIQTTEPSLEEIFLSLIPQGAVA